MDVMYSSTRNGDVKFTARSNGGHASAPKKNTPLVRLGRFMAEVEKHSPFVCEFSPTLEEMFKRCAPNMDFGMKLIFSNMWKLTLPRRSRSRIWRSFWATANHIS